MSTAHLAEWIRWTGVVIAVAGALIATPDGVGEVWSHIREPRWLSRLVEYLLSTFIRGRDTEISAPSVQVTAHPGWPAVTHPWERDADDHRKIEVLHLQHDLLLQDVERFPEGDLRAIRGGTGGPPRG